MKWSMKILHLISQPPDFTGSGKFIQQVMAYAKNKGHINFLMAGCQADFPFPENIVPRDRGVLVRFDNKDLPFPVAGMSDAMPYDSKVFSKMSDHDLLKYRTVFRDKIALALERFKPDVIHSHHLWIMSAIARELTLELPMVTTCHGTCLRQHRFCPRISSGIKDALGRIDQVMSLNPSQQTEIINGFGFPVHRVPVMAGGFDDTLFRPMSKPGSGPVEIVYAGKLARAKGVPWLLKSLELIKDLPFCLHIAGGGSGREKETCLALMDNLGDKLVYHGTLTHTDLAALMGRSHLFVLPSFFEGVPLVLMEALACGCRILSTDLPGVKEILSPPDQDLINFFPLPPLETLDTPHKKDIPGLEERLADTLSHLIRKILEHPQPDLTRVEQRTAPHTWAKVFDRIEQVYYSALSSE